MLNPMSEEFEKLSVPAPIPMKIVTARIEIDVQVIDFVSCPVRGPQMSGKIDLILKTKLEKDLSGVRDRLARDVDAQSLKIYNALERMKNLEAQLDYVDRLILGEIKYIPPTPTEPEKTEGTP